MIIKAFAKKYNRFAVDYGWSNQPTGDSISADWCNGRNNFSKAGFWKVYN